MTKKQSPSLPRNGGRPSREQAGKLEDKILDAAAALFFKEGYGTVSIEEIVRQAQISKRTFYVRFENKAAVFRAVVHRVIQQLRPSTAATDQLFVGKSLEAVLKRVASLVLHAALTPAALSLHRVLLSEATRFPELGRIMNEQGTRQEAIRRIADLLQAETKVRHTTALDSAFVAEQFLLMVTSAPQRRALELGLTMGAAEIEQWSNKTVDLFLNGYFSTPTLKS